MSAFRSVGATAAMALTGAALLAATLAISDTACATIRDKGSCAARAPEAALVIRLGALRIVLGSGS